ncbi:MAG: hypothetical protein KY464_11210 [Gemmatimonadetes bacterium]|nr:hypothetical protein [Gemmatimonadota bacterium]
MDTILRKIAEWKGRHRAAQVIVFDGGADVEKTRAFLKGAVTGIIMALLVFFMTAPTSTDARVIEELQERQELLDETNDRLQQAMTVANVCLNTAERLDKTIESYRSHLGAKLGP